MGNGNKGGMSHNNGSDFYRNDKNRSNQTQQKTPNPEPAAPLTSPVDTSKTEPPLTQSETPQVMTPQLGTDDSSDKTEIKSDDEMKALSEAENEKLLEALTAAPKVSDVKQTEMPNLEGIPDPTAIPTFITNAMQELAELQKVNTAHEELYHRTIADRNAALVRVRENNQRRLEKLNRENARRLEEERNAKNVYIDEAAAAANEVLAFYKNRYNEIVKSGLVTKQSLGVSRITLPRTRARPLINDPSTKRTKESNDNSDTSK